MTVDIASKLMAMRKDHGLSQEELADKLGVSRQSVGKWERAESSPDTDNLILLAQLYGVSIDKLLGTSPEDSDSSVATTDTKPNGRGMTFSYSILGKNKNGEQSKSFGIIGSLAVIAYLILGVFGYWHPAWIIFVAVPIVEFIVTSIVNRYSVAKFFVDFPFAVVATLAYLLLGCLWGYWHPGWILFLTVPLYHTITCIIVRKQATIKYRRYDKAGNEISSYDRSPDESIAESDSAQTEEDNTI